MGATDTSTPSEAHTEVVASHHPSPRDYVNIAVILAVITAAEVATYFFELPTWALVGGLTGMAIAKFAMVVGFYMHLKYDSRMFRRVFVFGVLLATTVFLLVLGIFTLTPGAGAQGAGVTP
jgi:cytochrome c oxidase subunit 4